MSVEKWLREYGDARTDIRLVRSEPGVGTVYAVEGAGTCFHVLGMGFFAFLPSEPGSLADMCEPVCRVPSVAVAVAGLVLAARAAAGGLRGAVEGDSHV
jgi:hypothetical protein